MYYDHSTCMYYDHCTTELMFGAVQVEGSGWRSVPGKQGGLGGGRPPNVFRSQSLLLPSSLLSPLPPYKKVTDGGPQNTISILVDSWLELGREMNLKISDHQLDFMSNFQSTSRRSSTPREPAHSSKLVARAKSKQRTKGIAYSTPTLLSDDDALPKLTRVLKPPSRVASLVFHTCGKDSLREKQSVQVEPTRAAYLLAALARRSWNPSSARFPYAAAHEKGDPFCAVTLKRRPLSPGLWPF